jgi:two-component system KDP operon response regulator KdpE
MKILLIEPDHEHGAIVQHFLVAEGYHVDHQQTAQAAIHAASDNPPDIIVLELAMAEHNGIAFLHEFRSYGDWMHVPIIIYSHIPLESTGLRKADWQLHGVHEYLYKPTTRLETLKRHIHDLNPYI